MREIVSLFRRPACVWSVISFSPCCCCRFHKQISERSGASVDEQSESVQEFYTVRSTLTLTLHLKYTQVHVSVLSPSSSSFYHFSLSPSSFSLPLSRALQSMSERLTTHVLFRDMAEEQQEDMMDGIEKHLMTSIYSM